MPDPVTPSPLPFARAATSESTIAATPDGVTVTVPKSPATGEPGAPTVAVTVKPWYSSISLWLSSSASLYFFVDALAPVVMDIFTANRPPRHAWPVIQKLAVALITAYISWRRVRDNTIIGAGKKVTP
jgi:hypothetical protein